MSSTYIGIQTQLVSHSICVAVSRLTSVTASAVDALGYPLSALSWPPASWGCLHVSRIHRRHCVLFSPEVARSDVHRVLARNTPICRDRICWLHHTCVITQKYYSRPQPAKHSRKAVIRLCCLPTWRHVLKAGKIDFQS